MGKRIENAFAKGGANFEGIGSTLEGFDVNPMMYEYVFEKAWNKSMDDDSWMAAWADRRAGKNDSEVRRAWKDLLDKTYVSTAQLGQGTLTNARPSLTGHGNWTTNPSISYNNKDLLRVWETMLKSKENSRDSYCFDVVNVGRQVLGNYFGVVRDRFSQAYEKKDKEALQAQGKEMRELLKDLDMLLSAHKSFSLDQWLDAAGRMGKDEAEASYYRKNARNLLTTWGTKRQSLNDYANRSWSGLTDSYYRPRWEMFITDVCQSVDAGKDFDEKKFYEKVTDMEQAWVDSEYEPASTSAPNGVDTARRLMEKYKDRILK